MDISGAPMSGPLQKLNLCFQAMTYYISGNLDFFFFPYRNIVLVLNEVLLPTRAWAVCE